MEQQVIPSNLIVNCRECEHEAEDVRASYWVDGNIPVCDCHLETWPA